MHPPKTILDLQDVTKTYNTGEIPFTALEHVSINIKQGEFLGITGKSGAGKTTLLNMIAGVSNLSSGRILYYPLNETESSPTLIHTLNEDQLARWRGENLGIIYQSFELMPTLDLVKNVMLPPDFLGAYQPIISKQRALDLLELVDIVEHAYKIPAHISGGQKQRVAIARALVNDPQLIIADEPTGNLDSVTAETIFQIFEQLVAQGKTVVMVTHDESYAPRFSRRLQITDGVVSIPREKAIARSTSTTIPLGTQAPTKNTPKAHRSEHPAIVLRGVDKIYENAAGKFVALKSVDLQLDYGQFISIVGKSGCGKSTLLNMITGIDHPTAGEVLIGNVDVYKMSESERALWRGKNLGVVFQFFQLLPTLTLLENTILPMDYCNLYPFQERPSRAMELLKMVGLEEQADKLPTAVSSGQQQSAAIARALATDPSIILADEPTGNLDSKSAMNILNLFERLARDGKTILIVTHDPSITQRTDQTIILSDGEIINQAVARALPFLSHAQMMEATHKAEKRKIAPGKTILKEGESVEHFFMILAGEVDIIVANQQGKEVQLAQLGAGQYFGEIELTQGGDSIAQVRGANEGAELALLPKNIFYELIDGSPLTRDSLQDVASTRQSENRRRKSDR
ncbi:MAG: ATP-binding cassette domain-containing protein [Anaerolineae bacterium]|nr:ATP-binding cassette domain-containing protein [Anaerolineae bacterium]